MKRLLTALLCAIAFSTFAQNDSVSLGAGAKNMVFYSLATHAKTYAANDDWHIAFSARYINGFTYPLTSIAAAVRINEAFGLKVFRSPNQRLAQWASFDTTGWHGWQQMHNPDTTWNIGAFNINRDTADQFNYGWGEYNGSDHNIYSDSSLYLIQLPDGSFKKFAILTLVYDTAFNVQYADLNGATTNLQIVKAPVNALRNFYYVNLNTNAILDKEPNLSDWDFTVLRYNNTVYDSTNTTQDIGIFSNDADNINLATGVAAQQNCYSGGNLSNLMNAIGKSWRNTASDSIYPDQSYFIIGPASTYKFTVTGFGGAASGNLFFSESTCATAGIAALSNISNLSIYPVPASDHIHISFQSTTEGETTLQLVDMTGRSMLSQTQTTLIGENSTSLNTASLSAGDYILSITTETAKVNRLLTIVR
jgi:Secretion system C-terminal sorting domain